MTQKSLKLHLVMKITVGVASVLAFLFFYWEMLPSNRPETIYVNQKRIHHGNLSYFKPHKPDLNPKRLILPRLSGRLGNTMFSYASMLGIAKKNQLTPVFPADHFLRKVFTVSAANYSSVGLRTWTKIGEEHPGHFEEKTQHLQDVEVDVVEMSGFFQSWRYFKGIEHLIREEFTFLPRIKRFANEQISKYISEVYGNETLRFEVTLIGVHVRVGDLKQKVNVDQGYRYAPPGYLQRSMRHFVSKLGAQNVLFIICTDSHSWVRLHFPKIEAPFVLTGYHSPGEDLAMLTLCDHVIMTVGTFGWWAGFLSKGQVIYYANYAKINSSIDIGIDKNNVFYNSWVPLS